jgi:hypothetical protein
VEDAGQLGHPLTNKTDINIDLMKKLVHENGKTATSEVVISWEIYLGKCIAL